MYTETITETTDLVALVHRCRQDDSGWPRLAEPLDPLIIRYGASQYRRLGQLYTREDLEEARQETYLILLRRDHQALRLWSGTTERSFLAYLDRIVQNVVAGRLRSRQQLKRKGKEYQLEHLIDRREDDHSCRFLYRHLQCSQPVVEKILLDEILMIIQRETRDDRNGDRNVQIFCLHLQGYQASEIADRFPPLAVPSVQSILERIKQRCGPIFEQARISK